MIDEEPVEPPVLASRKLTWPVFAITGLQFMGSIGDAVDTACGNLIMALGMHINYTYDKDDQEKAAERPSIRTIE